MENLEKSWNMKHFHFPGREKSVKKIKSQNFWKSHGNLLYSHFHLHSLIKRINIYMNIYSFNQTIVSHSFV